MMNPIPKARRPEAAAPRIESISELPYCELEESLAAQAKQNLFENYELLCEPACSSELENDILLEL